MTARTTRVQLRGRPAMAAVWAVLTALTALAAAAPAAAAAAPPPALSIELADGQDQVHSNLDVTYTVKVINDGARAVPGRIEITVPDYVDLSRAGSGKVGKHLATWSTKVRAGSTLQRTVRAHIGTIPKGELRVTALASMYQGRRQGAPPLIRTADADRIAGVQDQARSTAPAGPVGGSHHAQRDNGSVSAWWWIAGAAVVVAGLVAAMWPRRRRRRHDGPGEVREEELVPEGPRVR